MLLARVFLGSMAALALFGAGSTRLYADSYTVTAKKLDGTDVAPGTVVTVRAIALIQSARPAAAGQLVALQLLRGDEVAVSGLKPKVAKGELILTFDIDANDPALVNTKTILLVFGTGGQDTAVVPFVAITNRAHTLTIAVPDPSDLMPDYMVCPAVSFRYCPVEHCERGLSRRWRCR